MTVQKRNNVQFIGNGEKTIILAHGFASNQQMWKYILPTLSQEYRVMLFDYVGSGASAKTAYSTEKYATLHGYAQDIIDMIDEWNLINVVFVGHSISAMIGMLASFERPNAFSKLIMIGASPCYLNDGDYIGGFTKEAVEGLFQMMELNFTGWASHLAPIVTDPERTPKTTSQVEQTFKSNDAAIVREFATATFLADHRADLERIKVPTVLIQSKDDAIVPVQVSEYLHQHIAGSELVYLNIKGHYPQISQPEETVAILQRYI